MSHPGDYYALGALDAFEKHAISRHLVHLAQEARFKATPDKPQPSKMELAAKYPGSISAQQVALNHLLHVGSPRDPRHAPLEASIRSLASKIR